MVNISELKRKIIEGYNISYAEAVELTKVANKEELYLAADELRIHFRGNTLDLCSITNAKSGRCSQNCKWCSQSAFYETNIELYEMIEHDKAVNEALENAAKGVKRHSMVTSGRWASDKTLDGLIPIYKEIREKTSLSLCASLGLIEEYQLARLKHEVGIEHYHCNLETAPSYFSNLVSTHTIDEKISVLKKAQKLGINICSGGIIGMGESEEQRVELAIALRDLDADSIPINILTPVKGTPLENAQPLTEKEILTCIAIFRFVNPKAHIRFAGGRMLIKHFQEKALRAGISAALTGDYLTTSGSQIQDDVVAFRKAGFVVD